MEITKDILKRFFSGKYSRRDSQLVHELFSSNLDQQQLKEMLKQHWMEYKIEEDLDTLDLDCLLHQVQCRIFIEENRKTIRLKQIHRLQRIAAALFLPLLLTFMLYLFLDNRESAVDAFAEIRSPLSGKTYFVLPDGSSGFLNNGSVLKYPLSFDGNRKVSLKGEAYFDIVHTGSPFHVLTQKLDVKVMGTIFNVSAYEDDRSEEIILRRGKVQVSTVEGKELAVLRPDQQLIFGKGSQKFQLKNVSASQFTAWTEGKLIFRNESLDEVVKRLSRWYNVDFEIPGPEPVNYTFHATFMDEPLDEVLKLLSLTTPIIYEEEKRKIPVDGETLERRKITLKFDKERMNKFQ
jgi:ferric-dicitrate binding protein FerR (iron transport regulator)